MSEQGGYNKLKFLKFEGSGASRVGVYHKYNRSSYMYTVKKPAPESEAIPEAAALQKKVDAQQRLIDIQKKSAASAADQITKGVELGKQFTTGIPVEKVDESLTKIGSQTAVSSDLDRLSSPGQVNESLGRVSGLPQTDTSLDRITGLPSLDTDLSKIQEGQFDAKFEQETSDILSRRREQLSGFSREEQQAQRDIAFQQIGRAEQTQSRALQGIQAQQGVRGGTAASQQLGILQQGQQGRSEFERNLFLANEDSKRQALNAYEQSVGTAESAQFQRTSANVGLQKINLGQELQERGLQQQNIQNQFQQQSSNLAQQLAERGLQQQGFENQFKTQTANLAQQLSERQIQQQNISSNIAVGQTNLAQQLAERQIQSQSNQQDLSRQKFNVETEIQQRELQKYNIETAAARNLAPLTFGLGFAQLSQAGTSAAEAIAAQRAAMGL